jgi:hypothetical protein
MAICFPYFSVSISKSLISWGAHLDDLFYVLLGQAAGMQLDETPRAIHKIPDAFGGGHDGVSEHLVGKKPARWAPQSSPWIM